MSEFVYLGQFAKIQKGRAPLIVGYSGPDSIPYLNPEYLRGRSTAESAKPGADSVITKEGESVLLWDGSNAGEFFQARRGIVASTMARITPLAGLEPEYFFHALKHAEPHLKAQTNGTGIPHVDREVLEKIRVFKPDGKVQQSIASILDTLDTAIRETEAIIAKLKAVKKGLLHDLLTRGIDANGELRPPQAEAPHLYKQSPLGWIPNEWALVPLEALISALGQGWSPDCDSSPALIGQWGVLKTTSVVWEGFNAEENKALPPKLRQRPELEVLPGDILITRAGPSSRVGVVAYVEETREKLMISDKMYRLRMSASSVPKFVSLALSGEGVQRAIGQTLSGMAESQTNISQAIIKRLLVPQPVLQEQSAIVDRVNVATDRISAERKLLDGLKEIKVGLMDDLLTGRVRVTPLLTADRQAHTRSA